MQDSMNRVLFVRMKINSENKTQLYRKQNNFYFDVLQLVTNQYLNVERNAFYICKNNSKSRVDHGVALTFTITVLKLIPAPNVCKAR